MRLALLLAACARCCVCVRVCVCVCVCACATLGLTGNLSVWSRGVWHSRPTTRNKAAGESGKQGLISPAYLLHYLGKQEEMVLDTLARRRLSFCFPLVYSIGLQVGPRTFWPLPTSVGPYLWPWTLVS